MRQAYRLFTAIVAAGLIVGEAAASPPVATRQLRPASEPTSWSLVVVSKPSIASPVTPFVAERVIGGFETCTGRGEQIKNQYITLATQLQIKYPMVKYSCEPEMVTVPR